MGKVAGPGGWGFVRDAVEREESTSSAAQAEGTSDMDVRERDGRLKANAKQPTSLSSCLPLEFDAAERRGYADAIFANTATEACQ